MVSPAVGVISTAFVFETTRQNEIFSVLQFFFMWRVVEIRRAGNEQKRTLKTSVSFPLNFKLELHSLNPNWGKTVFFLESSFRQAQHSEAASYGLRVPGPGRSLPHTR